MGAFILSLVALYNGFPLVYSDTGTYISSGFEMFVPMDRPIVYGIFIRIISMGLSPWLVIIVQNLLTSFIIFTTIKTIIKEHQRRRVTHVVLIFVLTVFTGIGWYTNQLMPDYTTPLVILILFILLCNDRLTIFIKTILTVVLVYSFMAHLSHLLLGISFMLFSIIYFLAKRKTMQNAFLKRLIYCNVIVLMSWTTLSIINKVIDKEFSISKGSHVFLMAHMNDSGILQKFLCDHCHDENWNDHPLCKYKDSLPNDAAGFIWSGGIIDSCGGWKNSQPAFSRILSASISEPRYLVMNLYKFTQYGLVQLGQNEVGHGLTSYQNTTPQEQIEKWFPLDLNNYQNSRQNRWNGQTLRFEWINLFQQMLIIISCVILFITLLNHSIAVQINERIKLLLLFILLGILMNAMITGGLNSPYGRLQARVIWLLPFGTLLLMFSEPKLLRQSLKALTEKLSNSH
jgi:hypothetical protein